MKNFADPLALPPPPFSPSLSPLAPSLPTTNLNNHTTEDGVLHLHLTKADPGEPWAAAFEGHEKQKAQEPGSSSSPLTANDAAADDTARLLLERFQQEHPGFDFSGAQLSGPAPDPRTFLKDLEEQQQEQQQEQRQQKKD